MNEADTMDAIQIETARLGIEAEAFLRSALGRYLIDRADMDIDTAMVELVSVDPGDYKANREVRNKILIAKQFKQWLGEAIVSGQVATDNISEEDALAS